MPLGDILRRIEDLLRIWSGQSVCSSSGNTSACFPEKATTAEEFLPGTKDEFDLDEEIDDDFRRNIWSLIH